MKASDSSKLKIKFRLKTESSPKRQVLAVISYGEKVLDLLTRKYKYRPIEFFTGVKLSEENWDSKEGMPRDSESRNQISEIHRQITLTYEFLKDKDFTRDEFKLELEKRIKGKKTDQSNVVSKVRIVDFIRENILKSDRLKKTSKSPYLNIIGKIEEYEKKIGKLLNSNDINEELFLDFMEFIRSKVNRINAVWAMQKVFKAVLHEISRFYKIKVFDPGTELSNRDKIQAENADAIYLNMEQIQSIIELEPKEERLRNVKFIFMILLFTGCRESDVYKIKPESTHKVNGEKFNYVRYIAQKTETEILVPILKPLQKLFDRNGGEPPRKISQQKFNQWVKELVMRCKMDDEVTTSYTDSKGNKQFETKKLYQFVSSHTGRRSFITNLINFIPLPTLTKITGHKLQDKSIIFAYNKMTLLENAVMFRKLVRRAKEENPEYFPFELV